jgi:hypothetical protein
MILNIFRNGNYREISRGGWGVRSTRRFGTLAESVDRLVAVPEASAALRGDQQVPIRCLAMPTDLDGSGRHEPRRLQ